MNILIKGANVVLEDYSVKETDIYITDENIVALGELPEGFVADETIDGHNHLATAGMVNAHTHASMTLLRSYADDMALMTWLNDHIWPVEAKMRRKDIAVGAKLALVEMVRTGTTAFADMYGPFEELVAEETIKAGLRGVLSRGLIGFAPNAMDALQGNVELFKEYNGKSGLISVMMGVHAPYTCPPDFCRAAAELSHEYGIPVHIHMNETQDEIKQIGEQYGKRPFKYIEETGLFDLPGIAAHCVWMEAEDIAIMKAHRISAIHNPGSNMKLASGVSPIRRLMSAGVNVALGTDGTSSNNNLDMLEEIRLASILHKVNELDPLAIDCRTALQLGTENGAKALFLDKVGVIKPGYKADIVLYSMNRPEWFPRHDLVSQLVYAANSASIDTVLCNGKLLMRKGELLTLDEEKICYEAEAVAKALIAKA